MQEGDWLLAGRPFLWTDNRGSAGRLAKMNSTESRRRGSLIEAMEYCL